MGVALDQSVESHTGTTGSTSEASFSFNFQPTAGRPRGALVFSYVNANADDVTGVTYNGIAMTAVSGGRAVDTAGEAGDCKAWYLGTNVPPVSQDGLSGSDQPNWAQTDGNYTVVVGNANLVRYASNPDHGVWANASSPGFGTDHVNCVDFGGGYWVAVGDAGKVRYATDPTGTWSAAASPGFGTNIVKAVKYFGGTWVAVGANGSVRYATDPTGTWTAASSPGFGTNQVNTIDTDGTTWVAGDNTGAIRYATDPTATWSAATSSGGHADVRGIAYGQGTWVAVGTGGVVTTATDPTGTWTAASSPGFGASVIFGVGFGNAYWVAVAGGSQMRYSTSPSGTWTAVPNGHLAGVTPTTSRYCGLWLHLGGSGTLIFSVDPSVGTYGRIVTIVVTRNNNANVVYAVCALLTGKRDTLVHTSTIVLIQGDGTLAEQSVSDGSISGENSLRVAGCNSGLSGIVNNPGSPGANNLSNGASSSQMQGIDYGARVVLTVYETTTGIGSRSIGYASTTSDDIAAVHMAIRERLHYRPGASIIRQSKVRASVI